MRDLPSASDKAGLGIERMLPRKAVGSKYRLEFGSGYSVLGYMAGTFPGVTSAFPVPEFGRECVCCNTGTDRVSKQYVAPVGSQQLVAEPVSVPLCSGCDTHAANWSKNMGAIVALVGMGTMTLMGAWYIYEMRLWGWALGILMFGGGGGWLAYLETMRRSLAQRGHFADLEMHASPGRFSVTTRNRDLALRLATRGKELLHQAS